MDPRGYTPYPLRLLGSVSLLLKAVLCSHIMLSQGPCRKSNT